nr:gamma-glutamylcyclotransferase family protein [uncultured Undibacterium sp.]
MTEHLFVYGTLAPGRPNAHILADLPGTWEPAVVKGFLRQGGWGADVGYPGIVLSENGDEVEGFIFTSEVLSSHWQRLDDFEGDGYLRVRVSALRRDGSMVQAFVYSLAKTS